MLTKKKLPELLFKSDRELSEEEIKVICNKCVFCGEPWCCVCGTPRIQYGGCCIGVQTPKVQYVRPRLAHVQCFMDYYGYAIKQNKARGTK